MDNSVTSACKVSRRAAVVELLNTADPNRTLITPRAVRRDGVDL